MADKKGRNVSVLPTIQDVPDAPVVSATDVGTSRAYNNGAATVTLTSPTGGLPTSYSVTTTPSTTTTVVTSSPATITGLSSATSYTVSATATNGTGFVSSAGVSSSFTATTVPQAPGTPTGTATAGSVSVAFTPGATGGSAVSSYTVLSSSGASNTGSSSPIVVTETANGTYTYTVTATNANGTSAASPASLGVAVAFPAFESIATTTLSSANGTITFSSIPSTYTHLQVRIRARLSEAGLNKYSYFLQWSGSSTYPTHYLQGDGTTASTSGSTGNSEVMINDGLPAATATANAMGVAIIDIHDYASTTRNKTMRLFGGFDTNTTNGVVYLYSGMRPSTTAISSLTIATNSTFVSGSTFALYGIKGA